MATSPYDCGTFQPKRIQSYCGDEYDIYNRFIQAAFVQRDVAIDMTAPATALTALLAAELAGTAFILREISGQSDGGSPQKQKGYGTKPETTSGKLYTYTIEEQMIVANYDFWNPIEANPDDWKLLVFNNNYGIEIPYSLDVEVQDPVSEDINQRRTFVAVVKFTAPVGKMPKPFKFNTSALVQPQALFDYLTRNFTADAMGNTSVIVGDTITMAATGTLSATLIAGTGVLVDTAKVIAGILPAGITLTRLNTGAKLTGTPTAPAGTYPFTIEFASRFGVTARKALTLVVTP